MSHRRKTRRGLAAAVVGGALVAGGLVLAPVALAGQNGAASGSASTAEQRDFASAAEQYKVPESVLMGVAYQESLWNAHQGEYNTSGGFGPMSLTDVTPKMMAAGGAGAAGRADLASFATDPALHTLTAAAKLTGEPVARVKSDTKDNIRAGAALLASYEKALTGGTPKDPSAWYGAVARYSGSPDRTAAGDFADQVYAQMRTGAKRKASGGQQLQLNADPALKPSKGQLDALHLKKTTATGTDCPADLDCQLAPAATGNYQVANRPTDGIDVKYIVIHDTESSYQSAIDTFENPASGDAANYVMRSSDGALTQSVPTKDLAFHAGNYWFNMHSVGIEHEGYAAHGATWYTQAQYENTAELVKYLAARYDIPLDREHIIGHDNVPGPVDSYVKGMHWDPGPYWDWNAFMGMLGAPTDAGTHGVGATGTAVTISSDFATNQQTVNVCPADDPTGATTTCTDQTQPSNFLYVRTSPSATAPLFGDQYVHSGGAAGSDEVDDWGSTVSTGQQFVVAGTSGDWTAIWYSGQKVWIYNPGGVNTIPATGVKIISAAGTSAVSVYGEAYPAASEYPSGLSPDSSPPLSSYSIPVGQAYVATQPPVHHDDFFPSGDTYVQGAALVYTIQFNHRVALVNASDVTAN